MPTVIMRDQLHKFNYRWTLKDAAFSKDKGKVFSCFACGGGSTMGYKLAGFDVIGCNEIDHRMMKIYRSNFNPTLSYLEPIQTFKLRDDLPDELYRLDILDGSPPCSTFSLSGLREKVWGKERRFREGQAEQVLDTLFFDFIDLAEKLRPKLVVAENVKGLLMGKANRYVNEIYEAFDRAGYYCQHWLFNAADMGVPQRRERVFFICLRKDLAGPFLYQVDLFRKLPSLKLEYDEPRIPFREIEDNKGKQITSKSFLSLWEKRVRGDGDFGDVALRQRGKETFFNHRFLYPEKECSTITASSCKLVHFEHPIFISDGETVRASSFPADYDFGGQPVSYVCGMSVPPVMIANIATDIWEQWLSKIKQ